MKMKHWAYIGMTLVEANATLLGGARAAELIYKPPFYRAPGFGFLNFQLGSSRKKPPKGFVSPVKVLLFSSQKIKSISLRNDAGFLVSGLVLQGPLSLVVQNGKLSVSQSGHTIFSAHEFAISPVDLRPYEVHAQSGSRRWTRGELKVRMAGGRLQVVNRLEREDYVSGVLEGELGSLNLSPEILKAQIIVARTYVLSVRSGRHDHAGYEFCDGPHCQVFKSIPHDEDVALEGALASVRGEYLSYHGLPIAAFYHHSCGGMTSRVEDVWPMAPQPYLVAVTESPTSSCRLAHHAQWRFTESRRSLAGCFRKAKWLNPQEALDTIRMVRSDPSGRVQVILIQGNRTLLIPVGKLRNAINQYYGEEVLRSAMFTITRENDRFVFKGRGWGHGVGLCQEGAMEMARHGKPYQEILAHYFPKTKISHLK